MDYERVIPMEPGKRGGRARVRGMRITVADVLGWHAAGMSHTRVSPKWRRCSGRRQK